MNKTITEIMREMYLYPKLDEINNKAVNYEFALLPISMAQNLRKNKKTNRNY